MVIGWITRITGMYGCQMNKVSGHIIIMATGFIQITGGPGYQIITGVGHLFIMADGYMMMLMDGCGCLVMNGPRPGFPGGVGMVVMGGRQWGLV
jgi:hypothetical protein